MVPAKQAEELILNLVQPFNIQDVEDVDLRSVRDRILAVSVTSHLDFPHWDNSAMDGYAVRFEDVKSASAEKPVVLEIVEEIPAGYQPQRSVKPGQAARILTGSVMPEGADTIVIQEETKREDEQVLILKPPIEPQAFVRHRGAFYQAGAPLLSAGLVLKAPEIAVLAAAQCSQVRVYRRPRVAILSTGSELVTPDQPLQPGQIVDSNQYALAALVEQMGGEAIPLGIVADQPEALKRTIADAVAIADVVLSSGGVSVGDYDYVDRILAELGAQIHIRAVAIKPGKPLTVATFPKALYFGLPGNPVSALVTFWRFVQPALKKLSGLPQGWEPTFVQAIAQQDLRSDGKRESYLWGQLHWVNDSYEFTIATGSSSSGNLINLAGTNSLGVIPIGQTQIMAGESLQVLQI
ncbi:molybdopterin molybdenumtransferase MoeA [Phormidesmis priestleyi ULC007]|uniref:Molybdopterin molybdenumtransferase n=1 Tax=Phormidesmis priestleyi ULC007 TaxID=1920490 RepID=A0A2T1DMH0_9CYAN|nr:gephyrin-like molybdotransferase Glp [Phormidesmis priestleyi]PSB21662.1 molybdopterin molybdenumtransferase MoeA [Phormidesmis priestleyi ULC007]PZO50785.1 MAG: molybdopterin molybdenumtransferase MoeA [Phormidesmis priestleyi]